jgi:CIC family chloride channel protein
MNRSRFHLSSLQLPKPSEGQRFLLLSILIGIFSGLLVVCFHIAIDSITWFGLENPAGRSRVFLIALPAAGALVSVLLIRFWFPGAKGSGVVDTKAAIYISDGHVPVSAVFGKFLACAISIGSGNSLGPEDPSLHMGAGVASQLGRVFQLSRDKMRLIAPVGAAAGLAAAFNTPISAVLFVIEEIVADWSGGVLGSIVLAAVSAAVVVRWFLGSHPLFAVPDFELTHPSELLVYALIGVAGGFISVGFIKAVRALRERIAKLPRKSEWFLPPVAGLIVGITGVWLPQVMGAGYGAIDSALHDRFAWKILLLLAGVKLLVTLFCFSAKTPGGMFAPTLFAGAMIGGGIGGFAQLHWPFPTSQTGAYVLVGMGTFFAGVFRAPMTSIFMTFEVSASYVIILPVMISNTIAYLISRQLQKTPFFTMLAAEEGQYLPSLEEQRETVDLRVENAMASPPKTIFAANAPVAQVLAGMRESGFAIITRREGEWSVASLKEVESAFDAGLGDRPLSQVVSLEPLPRLYRDLTLDAALKLLHGNPFLPVSSRRRPFRLIGTVALDDIHRAYGVQQPQISAEHEEALNA